ncbi:MAG: DUF1631 family protein, partial [Gammaproteobacteria bacterium]|nr:DUF1631 family protein [Gammaproteobacteria bacterium]
MTTVSSEKSGKVTRLVPTKSVQLLEQCREIAQERLPSVIRQVMEKADDALFDSAEKADNSVRQNLYFDAMRELRQLRADIEVRFVEDFARRCRKALEAPMRLSSGGSLEDTDASNLTLVESSDVEESLAVTNFVEKVKSHCREELFALDKRMGVLLSDPELLHAKNPVGPEVIGKAFRTACQEFSADIEVKLVLYKLLDRFMTPDINAIYRDMNGLLVSNDILPRISSGVQRSPARAGRTRVIIESDGGQVESSGEDVFSTLQNLMTGSPGGVGPLAGAGGIS